MYMVAAQVADKLTNSMTHVTAWLKQCCLQLNVSKTVCMFFTKKNSPSVEPDISVSGERLQVVSEYKYLGVLVDSKLSFKAQVKRSVTGSNSISQTSGSFEIICQQRRLRCICILWFFPISSTV